STRWVVPLLCAFLRSALSRGALPPQPPGIFFPPPVQGAVRLVIGDTGTSAPQGGCYTVPGGRALHSSPAKFPFPFRRAYTGVRERRERSQESLEKTIPTASQLVPQRFGICEACVLRPLQTVPGRIGKSASRPVPFRDPMEEFRGQERLPSPISRRSSGTMALKPAWFIFLRT